MGPSNVFHTYIQNFFGGFFVFVICNKNGGASNGGVGSSSAASVVSVEVTVLEVVAMLVPPCFMYLRETEKIVLRGLQIC